MHRRIAAFFLAFLVGAVSVLLARPAQAQAEPSADRPSVGALDPKDFGATQLLVVHYRRADGNFDGWNLWAWNEGKDGAEHRFERSDSFGKIAIVPVNGSPARIGLIVRRGNWEAKDGDGDRFVELRGRALTEVWLVAGDRAIYERDAPIDLALRVEGAFLDARNLVHVATSAPLDAAQRGAIRASVAYAGGKSRAVAIRSAEAATVPGAERAMTAVRLARALQDDEIASLSLEIDGKPCVVHARGVLDDPDFTPLDAALGARCDERATRFATWSPVATKVELLLEERAGDPEFPQRCRTIPLERGAKGLWTARVSGDLHGLQYLYRFTSYGRARTVPDIHAFAASADSLRTVVVDLARLEPAGWRDTKPPVVAQSTDEVLYEIHVRDFSIADDSCPAESRGTYLGLVHEGRQSAGATTGLAHLKELGVTAVHLMPVHDFTAGLDDYNWGYWTALFHVPETNYASDRRDPFSAIRDLRAAVTGLHAAGIRVILDVVYNHTSTSGESSPFDQTVPFYYFRTTPDGRYTNDAGCGNSVADERPMVRKYILDGLEHWLRAYKVDGFRFDLLGTHDPASVRAFVNRIREVRPDATIYGEPWTGGGPIRFGKGSQKGLGIAVFNDHLRNAIRGDLDGTATGFATGPGGDAARIRAGVVGSIDDFAQEPGESINYASAHDNLALTDKIAKAAPSASVAVRRAMQKLSLGIVLVSQGVPFLEGGSEICRTKGGDHNSYVSGDRVNRFDWESKDECAEVSDYVRGLIAIRRAHPAFRMDDDAEVRRSVRMLDAGGVVAWTIDGTASGDSASEILVALNGEPQVQSIELPRGEWEVLADSVRASAEPTGRAKGRVALAPYSLFVAKR